MENNKIGRWASKIGMNVIVKYKFIFFIAVGLLVTFGYLGLDKLVLDNSNESMFEKDDDVNLKLQQFHELFGNEDFVFVMVEAENIFTPHSLSFVKQLSNDLEQNLPFAKQVTSVTHMEYLDVIDGDLYVDDLIAGDIPDDPPELNAIKDKLLAKKVYVDRLLSKDAKETGIFIEFESMPDTVYIPVMKKGRSRQAAALQKSGMEAAPISESYLQEKEARESGITTAFMQKDIFFAEELEDLSAYKAVQEPKKLIAPALDIILQRNQSKNYRVTATGMPVTDYKIDETIIKETVRTFLITLFICIILLLVIFRFPAAVIAPLVVILAATIVTFGLLGWMGIPLSSFIVILACLLLIIAVSYSIHIINHFKRNFKLTGRRKDSVRYAYEHASWPCLLTALTTAVGFASFLFVPMVPLRNLGMASALGVLISYILVMILIPIFLSFGKDKQAAPWVAREGGAQQAGTHEGAAQEGSAQQAGTHEGAAQEGGLKKSAAQEYGADGTCPKQQDTHITDNTRSSRFMQKWADKALKSALPVGIVSAIMLVAVPFFIARIEADSDFIRLFGDRCAFVRDAKHVTDNLGALYSYEVLIELPEEELAQEPEVLEALEDLEQLIYGYDTTKRTMSINDLIKDINMTMHNNDKNYFVIPDSRELVAQYLLLYDMSGGGELSNWVDYNNKYLRISVQVKRSTTTLRGVFEEIEAFAQERFPFHAKVNITGDMSIFIKSVGALVDGQIISIFVAFLGIALMMILVLRSLSVGLLSMIPNVLPVLMVAGLMGLFGFTLNMMTIVVAPLLIGIAVDDTVHYFVHFKEEFKVHRSYRRANRETFRKIGWALVFTSVILMIGFSAFVFTIIDSIIQLAVLITIGIAAALAADLLITPVLFVFLKPFGKEADKKFDLSRSEVRGGHLRGQKKRVVV
jgi:predicted RND superfamily exporter protein